MGPPSDDVSRGQRFRKAFGLGFLTSNPPSAKKDTRPKGSINKLDISHPEPLETLNEGEVAALDTEILERARLQGNFDLFADLALDEFPNVRRGYVDGLRANRARYYPGDPEAAGNAPLSGHKQRHTVNSRHSYAGGSSQSAIAVSRAQSTSKAVAGIKGDAEEAKLPSSSVGSRTGFMPSPVRPESSIQTTTASAYHDPHEINRRVSAMLAATAALEKRGPLHPPQAPSKLSVIKTKMTAKISALFTRGQYKRLHKGSDALSSHSAEVPLVAHGAGIAMNEKGSGDGPKIHNADGLTHRISRKPVAGAPQASALANALSEAHQLLGASTSSSHDHHRPMIFIAGGVNNGSGQNVDNQAEPDKGITFRLDEILGSPHVEPSATRVGSQFKTSADTNTETHKPHMHGPSKNEGVKDYSSSTADDSGDSSNFSDATVIVRRLGSDEEGPADPVRAPFFSLSEASQESNGSSKVATVKKHPSPNSQELEELEKQFQQIAPLMDFRREATEGPGEVSIEVATPVAVVARSRPQDQVGGSSSANAPEPVHSGGHLDAGVLTILPATHLGASFSGLALHRRDMAQSHFYSWLFALIVGAAAVAVGFITLQKPLVALSDDESVYCYEGIRTHDDSLPAASCFGVVDGKFQNVVASGGENGSPSPSHLRMGYVVPGLWDGHGHLMQYGEFLHSVDLFGSQSFEEVEARLQKYLSVNPRAGSKDEWVRGVGWDQMALGRMPTAKDLGASSLSDLYIMFDRVDVHCTWVSQAVLDLLPKDIEDVPGGEIIREPGMGVFCDNAMEMIYDLFPAPGKEKKREFIRTAMQSLNKVGLVGMHNAGEYPDTLEVFEEMAGEDDWTVRVYSMAECPERNTFCPTKVRKVDRPDGRLTVRSVKLFADGALGSWGSAMLDPYSDRPETSGSLLVNRSTLVDVARSWALHGFQVNIHAIGDLANRNAVDALEESLKAICPEGTELAQCQANGRFRIEHSQIIHPDDQARIRALRLIPSIQPTHATSDMKYAEDRLGPERTATEAYRMRSIIDLNPILGSDFPVEPADPFQGIFSAITRRSPHTGLGAGGSSEGWHMEEALTLDQALQGFTTNVAYGGFMEGKAGIIKEGAFADWIVLDAPIEMMEVAKFQRLQVKETWVGGKLVYKRPEVES